MRRLPRSVEGCRDEDERRVCLRIEAAMGRLIKSACKRRDGLEIKMGPESVNSPEYLIAAHEVMAMQGWSDWMRRNCDYRRMQIDERGRWNGQAHGGY